MICRALASAASTRSLASSIVVVIIPCGHSGKDRSHTDYLTRDLAGAKGLHGNNLEEAWYGGYDGFGIKPATGREAATGQVLVDDILHTARTRSTGI
jgi:hypothetical protein